MIYDEPSRKREALTVRASDNRGETIVFSIYNGMLPEELLIELLHQSITLKLKGYTEVEKQDTWYGPNEVIQQVLISGLLSAPTRRE